MWVQRVPIPTFFFFIAKPKGLMSQIYLPRIWHGNSLNVFLTSTFTLSYHLKVPTWVFIALFTVLWSFDQIPPPWWNQDGAYSQIETKFSFFEASSRSSYLTVLKGKLLWRTIYPEVLLSFHSLICLLLIYVTLLFFTYMIAVVKYMQISARLSFLCTIEIVLDSTSSHIVRC